MRCNNRLQNSPIYLLYYAPLKDDDLRLLVDLPLHFVALNAAKISGVGFRDLARSSTLTGIALKDGTGITEQALRDLKTWTTLRDLQFDHCALDREKLAAISEIRQLRSLIINADSLTLEDVTPLKDLPELATLYLFRAGFNASDTAALRKVLKTSDVVIK